MRIALLTQAVPFDHCPSCGLYNIAQAKALQSLGHTCEIFTVAPAFPACARHISTIAKRHANRSQRYIIDGVPINTLRGLAVYTTTARCRIAPLAPHLVSRAFRVLSGSPLQKALDHFNPQAIIAHSLLPWARFVNSYASSRNIQAVAIEHSYEDVMRITPGSPLQRFYLSQAKQLNAVITVSPKLASHLESVGITNTAHIPNGIRVLPEHLVLQHRRERTKCFTILCAGAMHERKGHLQLLRGYAKAQLQNAELHIVGRPTPTLQREIEQLNIQHNIRWLPHMPQPELLKHMAQSDLFALPSWSEAFGLVYAESLAAGTPVLMTTDCGLAQSIQQKKLGWVVPPKDETAIAIALQAAHRAGRHKLDTLGDQGSAFVRSKFTWQRNAATVLSHLENACNVNERHEGTTRPSLKYSIARS